MKPYTPKGYSSTQQAKSRTKAGPVGFMCPYKAQIVLDKSEQNTIYFGGPSARQAHDGLQISSLKTRMAQTRGFWPGEG